MENNENIKASFKGLIPFIVFILLYLGTGIFLNIKGVELAFYQLPGPVAAFAGIIVAFIIFKGTIQEKFNTFLEGCGTSRYNHNVYYLSFSRSFCSSFKSYGWS